MRTSLTDERSSRRSSGQQREGEAAARLEPLMLSASHIPHSWQEDAKTGTRREQYPRAPTGGDRSKVIFQHKFLTKFASSLQNRQNCSDHPPLLLNGSNHTKRPSVHTLLILLYVNFFNSHYKHKQWDCNRTEGLLGVWIFVEAFGWQTRSNFTLRGWKYIYTLDFLTYWLLQVFWLMYLENWLSLCLASTQ